MKKKKTESVMFSKSIIISSGYYGLEEYLKEDENLFALLLCDKEFKPDVFQFEKRIFFTTDISTKGIIQAIKEISIDFEYLMCIDDKFMDNIEYIKSELNLKSYLLSGPISRDKYVLKQILNDYDVKYPNTIKILNMTELKENIKNISYPVVLKPSNSYGSNGVFLVENKSFLYKYAKNIFTRNRFQTKFFGDKNCFLLVEEYINGREFAVDIIWNEGLPKSKMISSRLHAKNTFMFPDYVYYYDCNMDNQMQLNIYTMAESVGKAIGIENGATHTEMREKNGQLYILENAVRPGGGGCMYQLHRYHTNQNYFMNYCRTMNGMKTDFDKIIEEDGRYYFFMTYANERSGIVNDMYFDNSMLDDNVEIFKVDFLIKKGEKILPLNISMRYTVFIFGAIKAESQEEFEREIDKVNNACQLEVI